MLLGGVLLVSGMLLIPGVARADDPTCDTLGSVTPREGTVWSWFEHPCPPTFGEDDTSTVLPGVGVTVL